MPLTYRIDSDAGIVFVRGEGAITQAERIEAMGAWTSDPSYAKTSCTLCDFSATTSTQTLSELREVVSLINGYIAKAGARRIAVVAPRDTSFGAARQFQALLSSETAHVQVFRDANAALAWLRRDDPDAA